MRKILLSFLCAYVLNSFQSYDNKCFLYKIQGEQLNMMGQCDKRYSPASTFKIAISVMGFNEKILINELNPIIEYQSNFNDFLPVWKQAHYPKIWFLNSCVWYSQEVTKKLGLKKFKKYVEDFNYGNKDVISDKTRDGLTNAWLSSSLKISPIEQVLFIERILNRELPVSNKSIEMTKNIMLLGKIDNEVLLYGKTGNSSYNYIIDNKEVNKQVGWFVGWAEKNGKKILFANLVLGDHKGKKFASFISKENAIKELSKILKNIK